MLILTFLLSLIHLTTSSHLSSRDIQATTHATPFAVSPDHALINHVLKTIQSVDKFKCALLCMRKQGCLSANFYSEEEFCELNGRRREDVDSLDYMECQGCFYMEIQVSDERRMQMSIIILNGLYHQINGSTTIRV